MIHKAVQHIVSGASIEDIINAMLEEITPGGLGGMARMARRATQIAPEAGKKLAKGASRFRSVSKAVQRVKASKVLKGASRFY